MPDTTPAVTDAPERPVRVYETSDIVAMLMRRFDALMYRLANDPAGLALAGELQKCLADRINGAIYLANQSAAHYSLNELAAICGVSRQAMQQRKKRGEAVVFHEIASVRLADIRESRAVVLAAAQIPDRTGSVRERAAAELAMAGAR